MTIDLLIEMPQICREIDRFKTDIPDHSALCLAFDRIEMEVCWTLLEQSAQLHNTGSIGAIDTTYFERSPASRSYCNKTKYDVQDLKATKIVDTERNVILDLHYTTTREGSDADICKQLARKHAGELQALTAEKATIARGYANIFEKTSVCTH